MKSATEELLVAGGIGAVLGALGVYLWSRQQAASASPGAVPAGTPLAQGVALMNGGLTVTLQPGISTVSQALDVNTIVMVYLPTGGARAAQWVSLDGAGITDKTSPQAFVFNGPISHTYVWTDPTGATQTTTFYLTVAQTVPTVTT